VANIKTELSNYRKEVEKLNVQKKKIIDAVIAEINGIKQNGYVQTKSTNPNIFILSSKNLSNISWDPAYYDNNALSQKVVKRIENMSDIEKIVAFLREIVENEYFEDRTHVKVKIRCNKNFVAAIDKVLKSLE